LRFQKKQVNSRTTRSLSVDAGEMNMDDAEMDETEMDGAEPNEHDVLNWMDNEELTL
jgi:hypothetical protein